MSVAPLVTVDALEISPCGWHVVVGGRLVGGEGVLLWRAWPLLLRGPTHVIVTGHIVHQLEFSAEGDHLGVLSTPQSPRESPDTAGGTEEGDTAQELPTKLMLSLWKWPAAPPASNGDSGSCPDVPAEGAQSSPQQEVVTSLELRAEQVTRMSLTRGLSGGMVAAMLVVEDEVQVWQVMTGPLGRRLVCRVVGFGLLNPDTIHSVWCLAPDALAMGVASGWVVVSVGGEVRARVGAGELQPCHEGPVTDLRLHGSYLYTLGGDGMLRLWEAEMLEEAALTAAGGVGEIGGWCEPTMKTSWLQLVRELAVHTGPGQPVTLTPITTPTLVWLVQTNTGVVYGVWSGEWAAHMLHQGPSGRVAGVAIAPTSPRLATATHHRYLQVTSLPQVGVEEAGRWRVRAPASLASVEVEGRPRCLAWAACQVTGEDDLVVVGLEDGSVNLFLLHIPAKSTRQQLTLVQVERPHEAAVRHISVSKKTDPKVKGATPVLVTAGEDRRMFIFRLIRVGKITKLDPVGFHQLDSLPERIEVKGESVLVEMLDGLVLEIPSVTTCRPSITMPATTPSPSTAAAATPTKASARAAPDSWLLQRLTGPQETWEGVRVVRRQLVEEVAQTCCSSEDNTVVLTVPSPDGGTMVGVTSRGRLVHIHQSQTSYSVRISGRMRNSPSSEESTHIAARLRDVSSHREESGSRTAGVKRIVREALACVSEDGAWAAAWVAGSDLFLFRARGASFPLPQETQPHLRQVGVRGVGAGVAGPSLEQRAQKEAGERRKAAMEARASSLQQKLSKLKWDFRKLALRAEEIEGGRAVLEEIPLHSIITTTLHQHTTNNMNKVVSGSSRELERLEVLLAKLRTLYSWNPLVSLPIVQFLGSDGNVTAVDSSEEVFALLSRLAQIRQGREAEGGDGDDGPVLQPHTVLQVGELLGFWLRLIREGPGPTERGKGPPARLESVATKLGQDKPLEQERGHEPLPDAGSHRECLTPRPNNPAPPSSANRSVSCEGHEGDTSEEGEEQDNVTTLQAQVREVVGRVGSAGRGGGADLVSESDLDLGHDLKWKRMALTRLQEYRAREAARASQLAAYKVEHSIPVEKGNEGEGRQSEEEQEKDIQDEIKVPPASVTVAEVEAQLWRLLGKVELEGQQVKQWVEEAAAAQEGLLRQVNHWRAEWGHPPLTLPHLPHHLNVQVSDELVNEFYCDVLDLDESGDMESSGERLRRGTGGGTSRRAAASRRTKSSPLATTPGRDMHARRRPDAKKNIEGTDVPPLSLSGSPRVAKSAKTPHTTRDAPTTTARTARTATTSSTTARTTITPRITKTHRSGRGRRSVRETPKPPPAPRPTLTLDQVQRIQRARTSYLTSLAQVPEPLQLAAQEVDSALKKHEQEVMSERGKLAWAVLRAGQLVEEIGVRVRYSDSEKKLRIALKEKIREQQVVKEKVLALHQKIQEYEHELECLAELEEEVDQAFANLVADNAQFEVQLTRYFESRTTSGLVHPETTSSSGSSENEEGNGSSDTGDSDSGLGTDEARTEGAGPRPLGCEPAVFSLVTVLRELRWRVAGAVERCRRERATEERRHAAVLRRLHRATHIAHAALTSLTTLQSEREEVLGSIPSVVWLRQSQTSGDLISLTCLPIPNTEVDSLTAVKWASKDDNAVATLLTESHLQQLEQRVAQAKVVQELTARRHREGRAERRALTQQVEQLKEELAHLQCTYQVTKECKLGVGAEADLGVVQDDLRTSLDLRWPGKVVNQMTRHDTTMTRLKADIDGRTRELRALQKEEAALVAHILALRQEKEHLLYHLSQASSQMTSSGQQKKSVSKSVVSTKNVGGPEELQHLRATVAQQDNTISALRREIRGLRSKTGSVALPGQPSLSPVPHPSNAPLAPPSSWTEDSHTQRELTSAETAVFERNPQHPPETDHSKTNEDENASSPIYDDNDGDDEHTTNSGEDNSISASSGMCNS
ncbi:uncharacterized protein [Panulirus ornatus]|uniref:uncharacterized protein n=1 Tax=Panulirus ornatus TaxID=150431 RepID=UPI003A8B1E92